MGYKQNHRWGEKTHVLCGKKYWLDYVRCIIYIYIHVIPKLNPDNRLLLWVRDCESLAPPMKGCIS